MKPDDSHSLDLQINADFAGNWDKEVTLTNPATAQSHRGCILWHCGIPIPWASPLQSIIALSTTEAECVGMSKALQNTPPLVWLLDELKQLGCTIHTTTAQIHCEVFQDNSGALEIANNPKCWPQTKCINQSHHFFRPHVGRHTTVHQICMEDQVANVFTKPPLLDPPLKHCLALLELESQRGIPRQSRCDSLCVF